MLSLAPMLSSKCCGPAKSVESVPVLSGDAALRRGEFVTGEPTGRRMPGALPPRGDPVREGDRLPSNKRSSRQKRATVLGDALGVFGTSGTKASASALKGLCESRSGDESDCGMKSLTPSFCTFMARLLGGAPRRPLQRK